MFTTVLAQKSPDRELPVDLFAAISDLKKKPNAVILAHYYQEPDLQDVADYIGDSLGLSRQAASTNADVIVFAGVHFIVVFTKISCWLFSVKID